MKKRALSVILALALLIGILPIQANAGQLDNGLKYEVHYDYVEITDYTGSDKKVVIPAEIEGLPVTSIDTWAFYHCFGLTRIVIPDSVTYIGVQAFYNCSSLTEIVIPEKVTYIGNEAFSGCSSLTRISVDENNPNYSSDDRGVLFDKNKTLLICAPGAITDTYTIPNSVTDIGELAFRSCGDLTDIVIPENVTSIGYGAFYGCSGLTDIVIPGSVTYFGKDAFYLCSSLTNIVILEGVTYIGDWAFASCTSLTSIVIPNSVTHIGEFAFWDCPRLTGIAIPEGVTSIGYEDFYGCSSLTDIVIPEGVTSISASTFYRCSNLTEIAIPVGVAYIGESAFSGCSSLTSIRFMGNAPQMGNNIFTNVTATAYYPEGNPTWTEDVMQNYGGDITWVPYTPDTPNNPFSDVPAGAWFAEPVLWAMENGITSGTSENSFSPDDRCQRSHVATFLWAAEGKPEPSSYSNLFTDVSSSDWFYKPVLWAVENGITSGVSPDRFGANDVCSRYQVVFFLWKAAGSPEPKTTVNPFTDVNPGHFFYKAVLWAVENGITSGTSDTTFSPTQPCNRAQVVTFLYAAYN